MKRVMGMALSALIGVVSPALAQEDSAAVPKIKAERDTVPVQESIYTRPFIVSAGKTSLGGYVEGNAAYTVEDGVSEGLELELRRFNIFLYSAIGSRIRFLSELEFEDGTEEINLETALVDFEITPSLVLRGGILLPPIGAFNVNHDGPRWDFIDRPLVSTEIIPSTLSEAGFGVYGRLEPGGTTVTYDLYITSGLGAGVLNNDQGRTHLPSGKGPGLVNGDGNGAPAFSGRLAVRPGGSSEVGVSAYHAAYNDFRVEGEVVAPKLYVTLLALDGMMTLGPVEFRGEAALANVDVPDDLQELFGERQWGFYLDAVMPVWHPRWRGLPDAVVNVGVRLEHIDFNAGEFSSTGESIGDDRSAVVAAIAFRPVAGTVFKFNYRREVSHDLPNNDGAHLGGFQFGFATYF